VGADLLRKQKETSSSQKISDQHHEVLHASKHTLQLHVKQLTPCCSQAPHTCTGSPLPP
jgi:hypothetical protein